MSPECIRNQGSYLASDLWSLGVILHQLHVGDLPFNGASDYLLFKQSLSLSYIRPLDSYPSSVLPPQAKSLITRLLCVDPLSRPTIDEVLADPYFEYVAPKPYQDSDAQLIREMADDVIKRVGVYKIEGKEKSQKNIDNKL